MLNQLMQSSSVLPLAVQSPSVGSPTLMKLLPRHFQMKKLLQKWQMQEEEGEEVFLPHLWAETAQRVCQSPRPAQPRKKEHTIRDSAIRI